MKKHLLSACLRAGMAFLILNSTFSVSRVHAQQPTLAWAKAMGGTGSDCGNSIAVDAAGNIYTTGYFSDIADFDPGAGTFDLSSVGGDDIFISKLDADGKFVWAKAIGGTGDDKCRSIAFDASGNVYTAGTFGGTVDFDPGAGTFNLTSISGDDIFISKLDADGKFVWAKAIGGTGDDIGRSIALDASGNVYTTGTFWGTVDFDAGAGTFNLTSSSSSYDIFISKLDAAGNFVWARAMGGTGDDNSNSIVLDASGNVYTTGNFEDTADFDPGAGTFTLTSTSGSIDIFISKLDAAGNFVWAKSIGSNSSDGGLSIAIDANGNIYTTGSFQYKADFDPGAGTFNLTSTGNYDIFISKLDAAGNFVWAKAMGGASDDFGKSIAYASGNVYTTGFFNGTTDFDPGAGTFNLTTIGGSDIFISKLDAAGNFVWAKAMGGTGGDFGSSIALHRSGNIYTTGFFNGTVDFDPGAGTSNLTSAGGSDIFVHKMGDLSIGIVENSSATAMAVYPNPASTAFIIEHATKQKEDLTIYNILGELVYKDNWLQGQTQKSIDMAALPQGIYIIRIGDAVQKVVRE